MDSETYFPVRTGGGGAGDMPPHMFAASTNPNRGARLLLLIGGTIVVLLVILLVMTVVNTASTATRAAQDASLLQRIGYLTGLVTAAAAPHHYAFVRTYDARTLVPVLDARELLLGLSSGAPPSLVKGTVDLVFAADAGDDAAAAAIRYNVTVVHPDKAVKHGVTALELVVLQFTAKSELPVERASIVMCGGASGTACAAGNAVVARKDTYAGAGVLPANFDAVATGDSVHTTFLLLVYMGNSTSAPTLAADDIKFVVELET